MIRSIALSSLFVLASQVAHADIKCTAIHEWLGENDRLERAEVSLKPSYQAPEMIVLEADLDGRNFSLRGNPTGDEFLVFITEGPDYQRGIVTNGSFNGAGQLRVSSVDGTTVHKIVCQR